MDIDSLMKHMKTKKYRDKQNILDALENFDGCYEVIKRHRLFVEVKVESKQSTFFRKKNRPFTPPKKAKYMKKLADGLVATYGLRTPPIEGPIVLTAVFGFPWNDDSHAEHKARGWHFNFRRPDLDNSEKPLIDSMIGKCYKDDSYVVGKKTYKVRCDKIFIAVLLDEVRELCVQPFALNGNFKNLP